MDDFTRAKIVLAFITLFAFTSVLFFALGVSRGTEVTEKECRQELAAPHKLEVVITDRTCSCPETKTETGNE